MLACLLRSTWNKGRRGPKAAWLWSERREEYTSTPALQTFEYYPLSPGEYMPSVDPVYTLKVLYTPPSVVFPLQAVLCPRPRCGIIRPMSALDTMSTRISRRERQEALIRFQTDPEGMDDLLDFIANGGTLLEFSQGHDLRYSKFYEWVKLDVERAKLVSAAEAARDSGLRDVVVGGLRDAASADVRKLFDKMGSLKQMHEIPNEMAQSVTSVDVQVSEDGSTVTKKVRLTDINRGREMLGKQLGMFKNTLQVEGKLSLEDLVAGSMDDGADTGSKTAN